MLVLPASIFAGELDDEYQEAIRLFSLNEHEKVVDLLDDIPIAKQREDLRVMALMATSKYRLGEYKQADELYGQAADLGFKRALIGLGLTKVAIKDYEWLEKNMDLLKAEIHAQPEMMRVFSAWAVQTKNLKIFEVGLKEISDEAIAANSALAEDVLAAYRELHQVSKIYMKAMSDMAPNNDLGK